MIIIISEKHVAASHRYTHTANIGASVVYLVGGGIYIGVLIRFFWSRMFQISIIFILKVDYFRLWLSGYWLAYQKLYAGVTLNMSTNSMSYVEYVYEFKELSWICLRIQGVKFNMSTNSRSYIEYVYEFKELSWICLRIQGVTLNMSTNSRS